MAETARHFLYFVPDKSMVTSAAIPGLPERLRGIIPSKRVAGTYAQKGPGEKAGALFCAIPQCVPSDYPEKLSYDPDNQVWRPAIHKEGENPKWYVGMWKDLIPGPKDLERDIMTPGYQLECDSGKWQVPLVRVSDGSTMLPRRIRRDEHGLPKYTTLEAYKELFGLGLQHFEEIRAIKMTGAVSANIDQNTMLDLAEMSIGVNYHIGAEECCLLDLWTDDTVREVCALTIDLHNALILMESEKNASAGDLQ